jgi:hypothetical protein
MSLFKIFAISTDIIHKGISGKNGFKISFVSGISIKSSYISVILSHLEITPRTTQFLVFISFIFEIVFSFISDFKLITTHGKSGHTRASGQCFSSHVEYVSACI